MDSAWPWIVCAVVLLGTAALTVVQFLRPVDNWMIYYCAVGLFIFGFVSGLILWDPIPILLVSVMGFVGLGIIGYFDIPFWYWISMLVVALTIVIGVYMATGNEGKGGCDPCKRETKIEEKRERTKERMIEIVKVSDPPKSDPMPTSQGVELIKSNELVQLPNASFYTSSIPGYTSFTTISGPFQSSSPKQLISLERLNLGL